MEKSCRRSFRVRVALLGALALLAVSCRILAVHHATSVTAGDTFAVTLDLDTTAPAGGSVSPFACVGLRDPEGRGWDAVATGWDITEGGGSPSSGSGMAGPGLSSERDESVPDAAPWRCFRTEADITVDADSAGHAYFEVSVPRCARPGTHTLDWYYVNANLSATATSQIEVVAAGTPAVGGQTPEPPGANCPLGGTKIDVGCDGDLDGTPDFDLVTGYVCLGDRLTLLSDEPAGDPCAYGGQRIDVGTDDGAGAGEPFDGVLADDEIDETRYVCNGAPGADGADGATGPQGPEGPQGPAGMDGEDGEDGATGPQGPEGPQGPAGLDGADGMDGMDGATGPQGPAGQDGEDGMDGTDGATGPQGPAGQDGEDGTPGEDGEDGEDGADGATGEDGEDGADGADGATGPGLAIRVENEPAGDHCESGGYRLLSGHDDGGEGGDGTPGNGVLEDDEVDAVSYLCTPATSAETEDGDEPARISGSGGCTVGGALSTTGTRPLAAAAVALFVAVAFVARRRRW